MEPHVFMAVIAGAAMHAGWNAVLKIRLDPFLAVVLVNAASGVIALPIALYLGLPELHVWPWIIAALLLHIVYYLTLTGAYRRADMGLVYPIARGSAPLLTTILSVTLIGEAIDLQAFLGVVLLALGILTIAWRRRGAAALRPHGAAPGAHLRPHHHRLHAGGRDGRPHRRQPASLCRLAVRAGRRHRHHPRPRLEGSARDCLDALLRRSGRRRRGDVAHLLLDRRLGDDQGPIGLVAAVRESSVLFGAAIAVIVLHEPLRRERIVAAVLIVIGLVLIKTH